MRALLVLVLLVAVGCDPNPKYPGTCDYCRIERPHVRPFDCEECHKMHYACEIEDTIKRVGWSAVRLTRCPKPAP